MWYGMKVDNYELELTKTTARLKHVRPTMHTHSTHRGGGGDDTDDIFYKIPLFPRSSISSFFPVSFACFYCFFVLFLFFSFFSYDRVQAKVEGLGYETNPPEWRFWLLRKASEGRLVYTGCPA